jgi:hypothetical protein
MRRSVAALRAASRTRRARLALGLGVALILGGCSADDTAGTSTPVAAAPTAPVDSGPLDAEALARTFGDAVWRVEVDGCGIESGGSSFAIAPDLLVTNRHVVEFDPTPTLISRDGSIVLDATVIGMSADVDVALLRVERRLDVTLAWAPTAALAEGQRVVALGYPAPFFAFSVASGTLNAFDMVDGVRVGVISDEASDHGSSGGPLLTDRGLVAGIVTEFAGEGGRQVIGVSLTHDAVRDEIARILADPQELEEDCGGANYGTDFVLDLLWDWCDAGEMWACDQLFAVSGSGTDYEEFGASCGGRVETDEWCTILYDAPEAETFGDSADLDLLWTWCASDDDGWAVGCDSLYRLAPSGSEYQAFGDSCGGRNEPAGWCEDRYPGV